MKRIATALTIALISSTAFASPYTVNVINTARNPITVTLTDGGANWTLNEDDSVLISYNGKWGGSADTFKCRNYRTESFCYLSDNRHFEDLGIHITTGNCEIPSLFLPLARMEGKLEVTCW